METKTKKMIAEASLLPLQERQILADSIMKTLCYKSTISGQPLHGLQPLIYDKQQKLSQKLSDHPAFGHWRERKQDGMAYQDSLRSEWSL